jgi:hypothetical protein
MAITIGLLFVILLVDGQNLGYLYAVLIIIIRMTAQFGFIMSYLFSSIAFPTLVTGLSFTIVNICARFVTIFAPFAAETMNYPV